MFGPVSALQDEAIVHALYRQSTMAGTSWSGDEDCFFNKSSSVSTGMDEFTLQKRLVINNSASYVSFYFLVPLMSVIKCSLVYQCTSNHFGRYAIRCMSGKLSSFYVSWPKHSWKIIKCECLPVISFIKVEFSDRLLFAENICVVHLKL